MAIVLYKITNLINGKCYIGQTVNFKDRMRHHRTARSRTSLISLAIQKYGKLNFSYEILKTEEESNIDTAERDAIIKYNSLAPNGYNLDSGGNLNKRLSLGTRKKLSEANKGKIMSEETKLKIAKSLSGQKRHPLSKEVKDKISKSKIGRTRSKELNKKHSERMSGYGNSFYGKTHTNETKAKLSIMAKNRTPETKKKMCDAQRKRWENYRKAKVNGL